jgi:predicted permease
MSEFFRRLRYLLNRRRFDRELASEMEAHRELAARDGGKPFGNAARLREEARDAWGWTWIDRLFQDLHYASRVLRKSPGFTFVVILSLMLGIGANTAIFQILNAVRLRNLPVSNPRQLAEVKIVGGNGAVGLHDEYGELTRPIWEEIRRDHPAFSAVFAWSAQLVLLGEGSASQLAKGILVSDDFFHALGVNAWRGRVLNSGDERACPESAAMVSYPYWRSKMGGREIGSHTKLLINGKLKEIVGVTPPSFFGLAVGERFDIALPFCRSTELRRDVFDVSVIGRLRPGWSLPAASAQLNAQSPGIMAATKITGYTARSRESYTKFRLGAYSASTGVSDLRRTYDSSLWLLLAITGLVLLIACANLANLMLARAGVREREFAVRLALGAARGRLLRQLLVESCVLAATGAALGLGLAQLLSRVLIAFLSTEDNAVALPMGTDWRVLVFAAGITALACIVFGVVPAIRASGADPVTAMKSGGRGMTASRERFSLQRAMVVTQISISLVLLAGALLFVRSFHNLMTENRGMRTQSIILGRIAFQKSNVPPGHIAQFKRELLDDIRSIPGVRNAATTTNVPLVDGTWSDGITVGRAEGSSMFTWVSPSYFETTGIPLLAGRNFSKNDTEASRRVVVVNQAFVHRFLNGMNPIGQTFRTSPMPNYPSTVCEIVGVIPDTKYNDLRGVTPPMAFGPDSQFPSQHPWTAMLIHSDLSSTRVIDSVKERVAQRHPEILSRYQVFETKIQDGLVRERLMVILSGFFGLLAALLAAVGLYGVVAYIVTRRTNEIGIRLALGANSGQVVGMVMQEAGMLLSVGLLIGLALSLAAGSSASSLLFGLKPYDPFTLALAIALLVAIGAISTFLPAFHASKLDPMTALRCD